MKANQLSKLPRTDEVWEVGMIHAEHRTAGVDVVGLLVAVERATGTIRVAEAVVRGESPEVVLREAFVRPRAPARPGRPSRVVLDDPALQRQVAGLLVEAGVPSVTAKSTPALDDAIARLLGDAGAPAAPGIDPDVAGAWRPALAHLIRLAPWARIDDRVEFTFRGGGLDEVVATVMGAERIPGVRLHATRADLEQHRAAFAQRVRAPTSSIHLMLEPRTGLSEQEIDRCCRAGMQFVPGLYPRVYTMASGSLRAATAAEQAQLLVAVRAITALCERDLHVLAAGRRQGAVVPELGVEVSAATTR